MTAPPISSRAGAALASLAWVVIVALMATSAALATFGLHWWAALTCIAGGVFCAKLSMWATR